MRYLIGFATDIEACTLSSTYYTPPANPSPSDATKYYFACIEKEDTQDEWALMIPSTEEGLLTAQQQLDLKDRAYMNTNGRFPLG